MLLSLMAMLAVCSVVSATASAALEGPWYRHPEAEGSQKQVKWPKNEEQPFKAKTAEVQGLQTKGFVLRGKIAGVAVTIKCAVAESTGKLWNGLDQGEDEAEVKFTECITNTPVCPPQTAVTVAPAKTYSELQWKYAGAQKELTEAGGQQQKIYDVFAPTEPPKQNAKGEARAVFTEITLPETCKIKPLVFTVEAAGSVNIFQTQKQEILNIIWGTAAQVEPQNEDVKMGRVTWRFPNVTELHHHGEQTKAMLLFAGSKAELEGSYNIELNSGEKFGVYNE